MRSIIFIAPPGAGKGTLSDILEEKYGYTHISTGDVIREEITSGSELGKEIKEIVDAGDLIDSNALRRIMESKISKIDKTKPFIIDGYSRKVDQAEAYKEMVEKFDIDEGVAIYIDVNKEDILKRILGRASCPKCKKTYNLNTPEFMPKKENICDNCGVELTRRQDDNVESFEKRFENYIKETEPTVEYYKNRDMLYVIDGKTSTVDEQIEKILEIVGK